MDVLSSRCSGSFTELILFTPLPIILSPCCPFTDRWSLAVVLLNRYSNIYCYCTRTRCITVDVGHRIPSKPCGKIFISQWEGEREKESNKIPWLRGSCGILVLTESSSSLHSAVCFGRLSEVEICSSFHPQLCRNSKQHWNAPRDSRYATSESVISRFHRNAVSADMARLKANYSQRIKPTLRS